MAYGMAVLTTEGMKSIGELRLSRLSASHNTTVKSGSVTINEASLIQGYITVNALDGKVRPFFEWDEVTKTLTWYGGNVEESQQSSNIQFLFMSNIK